MGRSPTDKPARLAGKLAQIRKSMGLSQAEMVRTLRVERSLSREDISKYERGLRVPPLLTLLKYARAAKVSLDVLADDELELPSRKSLER